jgi:hypothetical protein
MPNDFVMNNPTAKRRDCLLRVSPKIACNSATLIVPSSLVQAYKKMR